MASHSFELCSLIGYAVIVAGAAQVKQHQLFDILSLNLSCTRTLLFCIRRPLRVGINRFAYCVVRYHSLLLSCKFCFRLASRADERFLLYFLPCSLRTLSSRLQLQIIRRWMILLDLPFAP